MKTTYAHVNTLASLPKIQWRLQRSDLGWWLATWCSGLWWETWRGPRYDDVPLSTYLRGKDPNVSPGPTFRRQNYDDTTKLLRALSGIIPVNSPSPPSSGPTTQRLPNRPSNPAPSSITSRLHTPVPSASLRAFLSFYFFPLSHLSMPSFLRISISTNSSPRRPITLHELS